MKTKLSLAAALGAIAVSSVVARGEFAVPEPHPVFHFPADHGSHPAFPLEWWYVTGHLYGADHQRFGYQATFFRQVTEDPAAGRTTLHLAHMAVLDVASGRFIYQTRLNRDGWDAESQVGRLSVRNGAWSLAMEPSGEMTLRGGVRSAARFELRLVSQKPVVLFGDEGCSRKGSGADAASYYLTFSRLATSGTLRLDGQDFAVQGLSWMDHEISSSRLGQGLVGWDWVCIQFLDGRELMMYRLRQADGGSDPASTLTWVNREGATQREPFSWEVAQTWTSPSTGGKYPHRIELGTFDPATQQRVVYTLEPLADNQEIAAGPGGIAYWEGACCVRDAAGAEVGSAYLELTGYVKPLQLSAKD